CSLTSRDVTWAAWHFSLLSSAFFIRSIRSLTASTIFTGSRTVHRLSVTPAAMAGVQCSRQIRTLPPNVGFGCFFHYPPTPWVTASGLAGPTARKDNEFAVANN